MGDGLIRVMITTIVIDSGTNITGNHVYRKMTSIAMVSV